jgi:hypothetical protein
MNAASDKSGPTFHTVKLQDNPCRKIQDLGIEMQWGKPRHTARLYRNLTDHAPAAFNFDNVVIHEEDAPEDFEYQPSLARKTAVGTFYPLAAYILFLYRSRQAGRNIFSTLAELDRLLPEERWLTQEDIKQACLSRYFNPLAAGKSSDLPVNLLAEELEEQGYRVSFITADDSRCLLDIGWQPKAEARIFFTGILEYRATKSGIKCHWMLPGPTGVNQLLRQELEQLCKNPLQCLSPAARKQYLTGLGEKSAKQIDAWPSNPFNTTSTSSAMISSKT